ncbi:MAG TPA: flavodoxin domain-containing protein [Acidobacteriota bacterium]|nr:flavodoxin domain-containing protein [Acidobacteriota bacterium]
MNRKTFLKTGLVGIATLLAKKAFALEFYPNPSDKKVAVVYGTWCGTSRDAGVWISEGMGGIANVFDVRENPDLTKYDHVVIGSSIRNFTIHPLVEKFIKDNQGLLKKKVRGYFAAANNMGQPPGPKQKAAFIDNILAKLCGVSDVPGKVFGGRITKELIEPETRAMFASFEDNDNLKRSECLAFGKEILKSL